MAKTGAAHCSSCSLIARLTTGKEIYPHRPDLREKWIWICDSCGGYVGCHPGTKNALGTCADAPLRKARICVHARLDPIWKGACKNDRQRARGLVYQFLAVRMCIEGSDMCHTGMFTINDCRDAWRALDGVSLDTVLEWKNAQNDKKGTPS